MDHKFVSVTQLAQLQIRIADAKTYIKLDQNAAPPGRFYDPDIPIHPLDTIHLSNI